MYPLKDKPVRDRLHAAALERAGIPDGSVTQVGTIQYHLYNVAVQDVAAERIFELESTLKEIAADVADALEPGNDVEGLSDALEQIGDRAIGYWAGNTTTRQPDNG